MPQRSTVQYPGLAPAIAFIVLYLITAMGLNVYVLPPSNSYVEKLTPKVLGDGVLGR